LCKGEWRNQRKRQAGGAEKSCGHFQGSPVVLGRQF
jgi:hypothetical protein